MNDEYFLGFQDAIRNVKLAFALPKITPMGLMGGTWVASAYYPQLKGMMTKGQKNPVWSRYKMIKPRSVPPGIWGRV